MKYTIDDFLIDDRSLTQRLSRLMTSFDETVAVMPYRSAKAVSRYDLWLTPTDEKKIVTTYVGGVYKTRESFRLYLRHKAVTAVDIETAEGILDSYLSRLFENLTGTEVYTVETGVHNRCATDSSVWDYYAEFTVFSYEAVVSDGIRFYVAFDSSAPVPVGVGCTMFKENCECELDVRRYFDGEYYCSAKIGEGSSIDFDFEADVERCALIPIMFGGEDATVYTVSQNGRARMAHYVLAELTITDGVCKGKLVSDGTFADGTFSAESGEFVCDKTERRELI